MHFRNGAITILRARMASGAEAGQGLVEYTLLMALASVVAVGAVTNLGETIVTRLYALTGAL